MKWNKQGAEIAWNTLVLIFIALIVALILVVIFNQQAGDAKNSTDGFITDVDLDCDRDGIKNIVDRCPCDAQNEIVNGACVNTVTCVVDGRCTT